MDIETKVRKCYEQVPFPDNLRRAKNFNKELDRTIEWIKLNLEFLSSEVASSKPRDILCAGCGTGEEAIALARIFPGASITAIDISRESLQIAKLNSKRARTKNVTYKKISIVEDLPKTSKKYDFIYSAGVIHHLSNPRKGFKILTTKLKRESKMVIMLYNSYGLFFYNFKLFVLGLLSGSNTKLKMFWIKLFGLDKGKNDAFIYDTYINPQVKTFTIEEILGWIRSEKLDAVNVVPPLSLSLLIKYATQGQKFFFRRQKLVSLALRCARAIFKSSKSKNRTTSQISKRPASFPLYKTLFSQLIYFLLGKGECQYLIGKN